MKEKGTIHSLTWLRAIAALMVCLFHFRAYIWHGENPNLFVKSLNYGYLGVIMFFVISGFVIPYSMYVKKYQLKHFFQFLLKRTIRIEPPYLIFTFILLLVNYYTIVYLWRLPNPTTIKQFLLNITYLAPFFKVKWISIIFWTLAVEFQFYILTGLVYNIFVNKTIYKWIGFALLLALGLLVPDSYQTVLNYYIYFLIGFQVFMFYTKQISPTEFILSCILATGFILCFEEFESLPLVALTVLAILYFNYEHKLATFFGNISFSLYLSHCLVGGNMVIFTKKDWSKGVILMYILAGSIAFATIYYYLVERTFLRLSKRVRYTKEEGTSISSVHQSESCTSTKSVQ
jgi:peptidoglycan/LPS O-acetylase OafA/YrhL